MHFSDALTKIYNSSDGQRLLNVNVQSDCEFFDISILAAGQKSIRTGTLYFADGKNITPDTTIPLCLLYYNEFPENRTSELVNSAQLHEKEFAPIFQILKNALEIDTTSQDIFPHVLYMFLRGTDLNRILTEMTDLTDDLFVIIDSTGKLIAKNDNFHVNYPLWMKSIEQGYCVDSLMDYIEEEREKNQYSLSTTPFTMFCNHLQRYIFCNRIVHGNFLMGYIFVVSKSGVFSAGEQQIMPLLANAVRDIIIKNNNGRWGDYKAMLLNNVLADALSSSQDKNIERRLNFAKISFPKTMRLMAIDQLYYKDDVFFKTKLLPEISKIFGQCQATVNEDNLIVLIGTGEDGEIPEAQMTEFKAYASSHKFIVGISNSFCKSKELYSHYDQAIRTLHFGKQLITKENIFFFRDYVYYALLDQVDDSNLFSYARHPVLDILMCYDREKNASLYQTLRVYTRTGFNKIKTAEQMFLHRNTVTYRIQQIEDLCGIDLSSMELLFPLQMSFLIDSYLNNRPI